MQLPVNIKKSSRLVIIITCIIALLSSFSLTISVFAYGIGETTLFYLLFYPAFLIATILVITNVRFGFYIIFLLAISYPVLLTREVGNYLVFRQYNYALFWVLLVPYLTYLTLIPMTAKYLTATHSQAKKFIVASIILAICFPIYAVVERFDMDYPDRICMDFDIDKNGLIKITGKPGFADNREFRITTNSKELAFAIKSEGELFYGSYVFVNTKIIKNFRFSKFQSITIKKLNDKNLDFNLTWKADEIQGDVSFLKP